MADPLLQGRYPMRGLYQALAVAAMCLQEQATTRPLIGDVVTALTYLASQTYDPSAPQTRRNNGPDGPESPGRSGRHDSPSSTHKDSNSPANGGRRWGPDEPDCRDSVRDSPVAGGGRARESPRNRDLERERAVAEAKVWGENWRGRKKGND